MNISISTLFFSFSIMFKSIRPLFLYEKIIAWAILAILFLIVFKRIRNKLANKDNKQKTIDLFIKKMKKDIEG